MVSWCCVLLGFFFLAFSQWNEWLDLIHQLFLPTVPSHYVNGYASGLLNVSSEKVVCPALVVAHKEMWRGVMGTKICSI